MTQSAITTIPSYTFTQSYSGYRVLNALYQNTAGSYTAEISGQGWGKWTSGSLPGVNIGSGYFLAGDSGARYCSTLFDPASNARVTGTLEATVKGVSGGQYAGTATFAGSTGTGVNFSYSGPIVVYPDGRQTFDYYGNWASSSKSGDAYGILTQQVGEYFSQTASGNYQKVTSHADGTPLPAGTAVITNKDAPLTVTDTTPGGSGGTSQASFAALVQKPGGSFTAQNGAIEATRMEGVVVQHGGDNGSSLKEGVMDAEVKLGSSPTKTLTGPVTKDNTGVMSATFQDTKPGGAQISAAVVQVPSGSGLSTASFYQTTSGTFNKIATDQPNNGIANISNPTGSPLSGTATVISSPPASHSVQSDLNLNSFAWNGNAFPTSTTGTVNTIAIGAVAGAINGMRTGPALVQVQLTPTSSTTSPLPPAQILRLSGTANMHPAANRKVDFSNLVGKNRAPLPRPVGTPATQSGTLIQR